MEIRTDAFTSGTKNLNLVSRRCVESLVRVSRREISNLFGRHGERCAQLGRGSVTLGTCATSGSKACGDGHISFGNKTFRSLLWQTVSGRPTHQINFQRVFLCQTISRNSVPDISTKESYDVLCENDLKQFPGEYRRPKRLH